MCFVVFLISERLLCSRGGGIGFSGWAWSSGCIEGGTNAVGFVPLLLAGGTPGSSVDPVPYGPPFASGHFFAGVGSASWGGVFGIVLRVWS